MSVMLKNGEIFSPSHIHYNKDEKVCAIDLDDCLSESISAWIKYLNDYKMDVWEKDTKERVRMTYRPEWVSCVYEDLYSVKKSVPYYYYRLLKEMYRQSDIKKSLKATPYSDILTRKLKKAGFKIVIITKRNYYSAKLTYTWLKRNDITFDEVIFSKQKHVDIWLSIHR